MKTELLKVNEESVALGARLIREGELVGFPTETVYGLGANALDARAVTKIFEAKGRPQDNPLITHVACVEEIPPLVRAIPAAARKLMEAFWPGPMTLILPKADCIPDAVSAGLDTVGIRLPANADARRLIRAAGCPIAAPSANRSGRPSPTTALHVLEDMDGRIPLILDGGACQVGVESSVIDATGEVPVILRPGGITPEMVERVLGHVRVDEHVMSPLREGDVARSPGMKYKHYAPKAKAIIFSGAPEHVVSAICRRYDEQTAKGERVAILGLDEHRYGDRTFISLGSEKRPQEAAARLFAALRELDERGDTVALCEAVDTAGIGLAVMNRMGRAAAFDDVILHYRQRAGSIMASLARNAKWCDSYVQVCARLHDVAQSLPDGAAKAALNKRVGQIALSVGKNIPAYHLPPEVAREATDFLKAHRRQLARYAMESGDAAVTVQGALLKLSPELFIKLYQGAKA